MGVRLPLAVVLATTVVAAALTGAASAQNADPYATGERTAEENDLDTDITPVAKESELWGLVHGARFGETEPVDSSVTRFDTDLFAVSFDNRTIGLAGGSTCAVAPERQEGEPDADFGRRATDCHGTDGTDVARVPALFRYSEPRNADPRWERLELPGDDDAGYIGAIAWIDSERALIVGGTGTYPRREAEADGLEPTAPGKADEAGKARAWLYDRDDESATELELSALTEDDSDRAGMRGFTAVGCYEDPDLKPGEKLIELCFAGALGQIWEWRDGDFTGKRVDAASPDEDLADAELFRFRVRDLEFQFREPPVAIAVTAGCCSESGADTGARVLGYEEEPASGTGEQWSVRRREVCQGTFLGYYGAPEKICTADVSPEADSAHKRTRERPDLPDSYYSVMTGSSTVFSLVATPGGQEEQDEPPSVVTGSQGLSVTNSYPAWSEVSYMSLSTARLLDGGGDNWKSQPLARGNATRVIQGERGDSNPEPGSDFRPDWVVGELRSTERPGLGSQGLLAATALAPGFAEWINAKPYFGGRGTDDLVGLDRPSVEEVAGGWDPADEEKLDEWRRSRHFLLPSYSANAVEIVGKEEDGWMVGDRGAILRLSVAALGATEGAAEPRPPRLRPKTEELADRTPYQQAERALPGETGAVPAFGAESEPALEPRMVDSGSVSQIDQIVMSRDGAEGWGIGKAPGGGPALAHFDGTRWSECDPVGIPGQVEADPACRELLGMRGFWDAQENLDTAQITHAARVPLEYDGDPSNDDELEILAVGNDYMGPETAGQELNAFVRYHDGRWQFEDAESLAGLSTLSGVIDFAVTGPDEAWIVGSISTGGAAPQLWRYDGKRWTACVDDPTSCGGTERLPRFTHDVSGLTVAGERLYLYGTRKIGPGQVAGQDCFWVCFNRSLPMIIYRDPGGKWTDGSGEGEDGAGLDPGFSDPASGESGRVASLSVIETPDGYEGWAVGEFGGIDSPSDLGPRDARPPLTALLRLDPEQGEGWRPFESPGSFEDYMLYRTTDINNFSPRSTNRLQVNYGDGEKGAVFIGQATTAGDGGRIFRLNADRGRFEMLDSARPQAGEEHVGASRPQGNLTAMAPDGTGGFWVAVSDHLFHYTTQAPKPVFEETANPLTAREAKLRAIAGGPDGSVWAATDSDRLYRFDRVTGWSEVRVGWDPGRVVTRTSQAADLAIGPAGEGLVVGEGGRIAKLSPTEVALDAAAGRSCALGDPVPCGTARDLLAIDIAPDGSAIAAGKRLAVLWRPAGGDFRAVARPPIASSTAVTGVSMPSPARAYLATDAGVVFRGEMSGAGEWIWRAENRTERGAAISAGALSDIAVDAFGHGYAVGEGVLERTPDGEWHVLPRRYGGGSSVELAPGGEGVLIGDKDGRILAGEGSNLHISRPDDFHGTGEVVGFAYLPGSSEGSVDAWAGIAPRGEGTSRLLRHRSNPNDPSLDPNVSASPLADAPRHTDGELSLAAFGKSDCDEPESMLCPEMTATTTTNEVVSERIVDELAELRSRGELDLAIQTGDATDSAGLPASSLAELHRVGNANAVAVNFPSRAGAGELKHHRYTELVADELDEKSVPLFAAIGGQDLTETFACNADSGCDTTKEAANAGENYGWREAFGGRAQPWGTGGDLLGSEDGGGLELEPAPGSEENSLRAEDQRADVDGNGAVPEAKAEIGGASTHYALDATRDGERVARIVFVDTSLRSLQASDALQQPQELAGGQQRFLERMICREGESTSFGDRCSREKGQRAIVVSNTPTYSYGSGALTHTALDATTFEALMLRHDVELVVSGALGYNGLYYTLSPGLHEPCPGGGYPSSPPDGETPDCVSGRAGAAGAHLPAEAPDPASVVSEQSLTGTYPTLIAAGAGGKFGPDGHEGADGPAGRWHGYSLARLLPDGDLAIEQRPILDWIGLDAARHVIRPRQKLHLRGYGRSPISTATSKGSPRTFTYEISTAAITHRYDLLRADPEQSWLALEDAAAGAQADGPGACGGYVCLPSEVAKVDPQSGQVKAGSGNHPPTYAIAMLSVGEEVATYPLHFEPSPSFRFTAPSAPRPTPTVAPVAAPGAPTTPPSPQIPSVSVPTPPVPPALVPPPPAPPATPPQPPVPPPVPPADAGPSALSLSFAPTGLVVAPTASVIPPPAPPINPAPPGGARKEARQRQAATQKSGADSNESANDATGDLAEGPVSGTGSNEMTRHEAVRATRARPGASFTPLDSSDQPSAWASGLQWGAGLTLGAFALALGFTTLRPGSRRRQPEVPAPARAAARR